MIVLRKEVVREYLKATRRNQNWLAEEMGYTKGYVSQVMNDGCKISAGFIESMLLVTHIPFDVLFYYDGRPDTREYYGEVFVLDGETMNKRKFFEDLRSTPRAAKKDWERVN